MNYLELALDKSRAAAAIRDREEVLYLVGRLRALALPKTTNGEINASIADRHRRYLDYLDGLATDFAKHAKSL